jgi:hypothetical protein
VRCRGHAVAGGNQVGADCRPWLEPAPESVLSTAKSI